MREALTLNISKSIHRVAVGSFFFVSGLTFSSWASRIPSIQQSMNLGEGGLGAVLFSLPAGSIAALPFSGWVISKFGSRKVVILTSLLYIFTLATLGLAQSVFQLVAVLLAFGFAGNMLNIGVNTQAVGVEHLYKRPIMASFHGLWSLAGFAGASIGSMMIDESIVPYHHFLVILTIGLLILLVGNRYILPFDRDSNVKQALFVKPDKYLINLGIIAFCCMICEGAMFDWSGIYFKDIVQADKAWIGAGYTAFMCTMAFGRFVADRLAHSFGIKKVLQASGVLIATGLLTASFFPNLITAIAGFFVVGFGVSSVVPLVYSAAGRSKTLSAGAALAAVSSISFIGFLIGPPVIGLVASVTSLRISFFIIAIMGLCVSLVASRSKIENG